MNVNVDLPCEDLIWLASWPRSGNTLLRMILWHKFGLRSSSVYKGEMSGLPEAERICGHVPLDHLGDHPPPYLIKTHALPDPTATDERAIYVLRDGRAAMWSLKHWRPEVTMESIISHRVATGDHASAWSEHVDAWLDRPNTLIVPYQSMLFSRRTETIRILGQWLGIAKKRGDSKFPTFDTIREGKYFRKGGEPDWQQGFDQWHQILYDRLHGKTHKRVWPLLTKAPFETIMV